MKKMLVNGVFSSIPLAHLLTSTADIDPEDEVRDEDPSESVAED